MAQVFLFMLVGGMAGVLAAAPLELMAWRYLRNVGMIGLALAAGTVAWTVRSGDWPADPAGAGSVAFGAVSVLSFAAWVVRAGPRARAGWLKWVSGLAAIGALGAALAQMTTAGWLAHPRAAPLAMTLGSALLGAAVLGAVTTAWLLGHAYLTATRMTIAPLAHLSRVLFIAAIVRALGLLFAGIVLLTWGRDAYPTASYRLEQNWLVGSLRAGLGGVALPVFAYMVADCVKRRATQAATGILYFASVFAYISELCGLYLIREVGWPL